jgi:O-antigen/teichoic acid export membrane protein
MFKNKILLNSITSLMQMSITLVITFFQYRYLFKTLGVSNLGIWSIVLSVNFFLGVSGFGMQGSIIKYVSKYYTKNNLPKTVDVIQTALSSMIVFSFVGTIIAYPVTIYILRLFLDTVSYNIACKILPIAFISFITSMISSITTSSLDGLNRIYARNIILITISIFVFILILKVTPVWGLIGLTYIKLIESVLILSISFIMLRRYLPAIPLFPVKWSKEVFKEIIGYSLKFQLINFSVLLSDPLAKLLLSKFGGVAYVGIYELANKMVFQIRALVVAAYQTLVPAVASYQETEPQRIRSFYTSSYKLLFFICTTIFTLLLISAPVISNFWLGEINKRFIFLLSLYSVSWFVNSLTISAYFTNMGTGDINDNVIAHVLVGLFNIIAGLILGYTFGGDGVAIAIAVAVSIGGFYQLCCFHWRNKLLDQILPRETKWVALFCIVIVTIHLILLKKEIDEDQYVLFNIVEISIGIAVVSLIIVKDKVFQGIIKTGILKFRRIADKVVIKEEL